MNRLLLRLRQRGPVAPRSVRPSQHFLDGRLCPPFTWFQPSVRQRAASPLQSPSRNGGRTRSAAISSGSAVVRSSIHKSPAGPGRPNCRHSSHPSPAAFVRGDLFFGKSDLEQITRSTFCSLFNADKSFSHSRWAMRASTVTPRGTGLCPCRSIA